MTSHDPTPSNFVPDAMDSDLRAQAAMYRIITENTIDIILRYDSARSRIYASPACREMLGYEPAEMIALKTSETIHPDDFPKMEPIFQTFGPDRPRLTLEFRIKRQDGVYIWVEVQHRYVFEDGGSIAVMRDVTARKNAELMLEEANETLHAANAILQRLAQRDGLTGLANRRRFDELLEEEFRRAVRQTLPLAVLLLDVDHFKSYNDRYGHMAGDECLRGISRGIEAALERPGDHAARYGGEEFVILLPSTGLAGAIAVAERVRDAAAALVITHLDNPYGVVTVSIGVCAVIPSHNDRSADIVAAADTALYRAKSEGRNQVRCAEAGAFVSAG